MSDCTTHHICDCLNAKLEKYKEVLEDIVMNTSTDMPAAWNDELSWYRNQLYGVIGRAARARKALEGDKK